MKKWTAGSWAETRLVQEPQEPWEAREVTSTPSTRPNPFASSTGRYVEDLCFDRQHVHFLLELGSGPFLITLTLHSVLSSIYEYDATVKRVQVQMIPRLIPSFNFLQQTRCIYEPPPPSCISGCMIYRLADSSIALSLFNYGLPLHAGHTTAVSRVVILSNIPRAPQLHGHSLRVLGAHIRIPCQRTINYQL